MKLNLNCFLARNDSPQRQQQIPSLKPLPLADFQNSRPFQLPEKPVEASWVSLGLPAAIHESPVSRLNPCHVYTATTSPSESRLPDKLRHLGEILKSFDHAQAKSEFQLSKQLVPPAGAPYRRNWLETDFPLLKDPIVEGSQSSRLCSSVRSTPRENNLHAVEKASGTGFDLEMQLKKLEEMLKHEESSGKKQEETDSRHESLELDVLRDVLVRLGRVETLSRRIRHVPREDCQHKVPRARIKHTIPGKKRPERPFKSFMSKLQDHMGKTDAAVRKVEKELQKLTSTRKRAADVQASKCYNSFAGDYLLQSDNVASSALEQRMLSVQTELQRMVLMSTDEVRKQCDENKTDIKLCWSAMNQLCIDNEAFRQELLQLKATHAKFKSPLRDDLEAKTTTTQQESEQCGRWSCTGALQ